MRALQGARLIALAMALIAVTAGTAIAVVGALYTPVVQVAENAGQEQ
jgi:hypothetical protein